jgi:uncharacterized LabA/DUF88 family protein
MGRVAVFIDGGYLDKTLKLEFGEAKMDYGKFAADIAGADLFRVYYYYAMPFLSDPPSEEEKERYRKKQRFITRLSNLPPFELRKGRLQFIGGEFKQKRVDNLLTCDLVRLAWLNKIDTAVIVGGDDDFVPAVTEAKQAGVSVRLYYSPKAISNELAQKSDEPRIIDENLIRRNVLTNP